MANHEVEVFRQQDGQWLARCTCLVPSVTYAQEWEADDWRMRHERVVQQARAHLLATPSLKGMYDYYVKMAEDTANSPEDRAQWRILAEELKPRVIRSTEDEPELFDTSSLRRGKGRDQP